MLLSDVAYQTAVSSVDWTIADGFQPASYSRTNFSPTNYGLSDNFPTLGTVTNLPSTLSIFNGKSTKGN
jgi:hypothetical protein